MPVAATKNEGLLDGGATFFSLELTDWLYKTPAKCKTRQIPRKMRSVERAGNSTIRANGV